MRNKGGIGFRVSSERDARKAHVAKLHGKAQPICRATPLSNEGQVGVVERVVPDQFIFGVWQCQQAFALSGGQDRTTRHVVSFFLKTRDFERLHQTANVTREIKALQFSKIVLEMLFSIP